MKTFFYALLVVVIAGYGCTAIQKSSTTAQNITSLRLLDVYEIPHRTWYDSTLVGGLSGIDYDKKNNQYFIISDERSATSPSRFYTTHIAIHHNKIDTVLFTGVHTLLQPGGQPFPSLKKDPVQAADPEAIRYNPVRNTLVWTSEGDKAMRGTSMNIRDPFVYEMNKKGQFIDSFSIPPLMRMTDGEGGPRVNGVFEGASFDADYKHLYVSMEMPLYEDGSSATVHYAHAPVRIIKFDAGSRKVLAQYAYLLDAVAQTPEPPTAFSGNGVSEIYCWDKDNMLVVERSYSTGFPQCTIKIFMANFKNATDVSDKTALHQRNDYTPMRKQLLLNMSTLGVYIDNVEGITLGPVLPNGHSSLLLITDNNFQSSQKSQLFLLEIIP